MAKAPSASSTSGSIGHLRKSKPSPQNHETLSCRSHQIRQASAEHREQGACLVSRPRTRLRISAGPSWASRSDLPGEGCHEGSVPVISSAPLGVWCRTPGCPWARDLSSPHEKSFLGVTSCDGFSLETNTNATVSFAESTTLLHPDCRKAFLTSCTCRNWMKRFPESCISLWSWKLLEWEIPEVGRLPLFDSLDYSEDWG